MDTITITTIFDNGTLHRVRDRILGARLYCLSATPAFMILIMTINLKVFQITVDLKSLQIKIAITSFIS